MEFAVIPFSGDQLAAVAELTRPDRDRRLVLLSDDAVWQAVSGGRRLFGRPAVSTTAVTTGTGELLVACADLRRIKPTVAGVSTLATRLAAEDADIVAVHDADRWSRAATARLVRYLRGTARSVVFFTEPGQPLGELATVTPDLAVIGDHGNITVVGSTTSGAGTPRLRHSVPNPRDLRIDDIVASFARSPDRAKPGEPAEIPGDGGMPPPRQTGAVPPMTAPREAPQVGQREPVRSGAPVRPGVPARPGAAPAPEIPVDAEIVDAEIVDVDSRFGPDYPVGSVAPAAPEVRSVNSRIVAPGGEDGVPAGEPLVPGAAYEVLVNIGPHDASSLLPEADGRWPADRLPGGGLRLRAVLRVGGMPAPLVAAFTLPASGPSFACDCTEPDGTEPGGTERDGGRDGPGRGSHGAGCAARPWVRFPVTAPQVPGVWTGELVIYYEVVAVHAQQLVLPVGVPAADGLHARLLYRLTRSFNDLGPLHERTASVLVTDGGSRALVNGLRFADNPAWISASAADNAVRAARQLLYDQHLDDTQDGPVSRLDERYGKEPAEFVADLADLARWGAVIYDRLFTDNTVFDTLPELIRHEAAARGRPAVLNVADPTIGDPDRQHPVPWSLVYDLRIPQDPRRPFRICPSVHAFGPGGAAGGEDAAVPPHCPEPDHGGNVLCPFGFWGLACVLEQPPSAERVVWHVLDGAEPVSVAMAVDPGLDGGLTTRHLARLRSLLPDCTVTDQTITDPDELARALAGETMDVAYLYCHGGYHQLASNAMPSPVLRFGGTVLDPVEVGNWRRDATLWPRPHWPHRKPLIVLNGCHTTELTTATLSNFVDAFANRAGAAGVIGTEVTLEQGMAGWAMEMLLRLLVDGADVGTALRQVRWRMISRGNVMGLAYTPYCVAGLRIRPAPDAHSRRGMR